VAGRRVTRVSRGLRVPVVQEPVRPPPSVRDQVIYEPQWPEGVELDPGIGREPPTETMDVPVKLPRLSQRQEIATSRKRRRGLRPGVV
jgi:hypothetical protein